MPPKLTNIPDLQGGLQQLISQIPAGRVAAFGDLARALGDIAAAKWVASCTQAWLADPSISLPLHRIVRQTGEIPPWQRPRAADQQLQAEGVTVTEGHVSLPDCGGITFQTDFLLSKLRDEQTRLASQVSLQWTGPIPELVGGIDVSYPKPELGIATYTLMDLARGEIIWTHSEKHPATFPYISGYLAFRELPVMLTVLRAVATQGQLAPVLLVDGNGVLHPRHLGIASHLGLLLDQPTIGVGKTRIRPPRSSRSTTTKNTEQDSHFVTLMRSSGGALPIYISPGHRIDLATATQIVTLCTRLHRLPEPLYWADRLSRQQARQHIIP